MAGYGSDEGFEAWLEQSGYATSTGDLTIAQLRQRGSDYVDALFEPRLPGYRAGGLDQERAWPRTGAEANGSAIPSSTIPMAWINASYHAALHESANPGSLAVAVVASQQVKRKKLDVLETEYFGGSGDLVGDATVRLSAVDGLLSPFFARAAAGAVFVV